MDTLCSRSYTLTMPVTRCEPQGFAPVHPQEYRARSL